MNPVDDLAVGAWTRLRNLIGALDRTDRLETSREFAGWLQGLAADEPRLKETIREFLLRALRLASDPVNTQILVQLNDSGSATTNELSKATGLSRVELVERLNELARAGLTVQSLDSDQIEGTLLARGFLSLTDEIASRMKTLASDDYLLNSRATVKSPRDRVTVQSLESKSQD